VLGRQLENELLDALAVAARCRGVDVYRELNWKFDGEKAATENYLAHDKIKQQHQLYWILHLDFEPGQNTYGWSLIPWQHGEAVFDSVVEGEGTSREVADQVCTVVTGQGAAIH
jgi:hypothetical protein